MTTITRFEQTTPPTRRNVLNGSTAKVVMLSALCSAYIQGALTKLFDFEGAIQEMTHFGLLPAPLFAAGVIAFELVTSAMVITGFRRRTGALALAAFTLAATFIALQFWSMPEGPARTGAANAFFEHLGLVAAFLLVAWTDLSGQTSKKPA
jgi:uncharacterized membrane protein YphA (DoxX/SURF4 family)